MDSKDKTEILKQKYGDVFKNAEAGDAASQFYLGYLYYYYGFERSDDDTKKAIELFENAQQYDLAAMMLGLIYSVGENGVEVDRNKAVEWYKRVGDNVFALYQIASLYHFHDEEKAIEYYTKAAEKGFDKVQLDLGRWYYRKGDYQQALKWYNMAASSGNVAAIDALQDIRLWHPPERREIEFEWVKKAADSGNGEAQQRLAEVYSGYYDLVQEDHLKAAKWFEKALQTFKEQEHVTGIGNNSIISSIYRHMAYLYEQDGYGLKQDAAKALKYYIAAVECGDKYVLSNIARIYEYGGEGVEQDSQKAVEYYKKALGATCFYGELESIGDIYKEGGNNVPQDSLKAIEYYTKAYERNGCCASKIGELYAQGEGNVTKDLKKAIEWYQKDQDGGFALYKIGEIYEELNEYEKAIEYFKKSACENVQDALWRLGCYYEFGIHVQRDYQKACEYFKRANDDFDSTECLVHVEAITRFNLGK